MPVLVPALLLGLAMLALLAFGPDLRRAAQARRRTRRSPRHHVRDPGRERRSELKARELLREVVGEQQYAMYRELGFIHAPGGGPDSGYGYLIYPQRPIVAFEQRSGEPLNEYCVVFPEFGPGSDRERLPDADDVLAKWMVLSGDERGLIGDANMHAPGKQHDPALVRRDLLRLREWEGRRRAESSGSKQADAA